MDLQISGQKDKKSEMISEEESKIRQDKLDTEKITSFVSMGGDSGRGVNIRFSDRSDQRKTEVTSSPVSAGSSECIQSQLAAVKLKLEQKRKKIEEDKKKVELMMSKQREKVGQEAFLRAVAKGMERSPKEGGQKDVSDQDRQPFMLKESSKGSHPGTPEVERNTLDLYQLQRGLQRQQEPFYISQPPVTPPAQQLHSPNPYYMYPGPHPGQHPGPHHEGHHPGYQPGHHPEHQPGSHPGYQHGLHPGQQSVHHPPPSPWYGMMPYPSHHSPYYPAPHIMAPPPHHPSSLQPDSKPPPLTDKPSLSTSFLEMKRRQYQAESPSHTLKPPTISQYEAESPSHQLKPPGISQYQVESPSHRQTPRSISPRLLSPSSPAKQSLSTSFLKHKAEKQLPSSPVSSQHNSVSQDINSEPETGGESQTDNCRPPSPSLTRSTLDTLASMTTESISKADEDLSKGFVISFDAPVKPKPSLKSRQSSVGKVELESVVRKVEMESEKKAESVRQVEEESIERKVEVKSERKMGVESVMKVEESLPCDSPCPVCERRPALRPGSPCQLCQQMLERHGDSPASPCITGGHHCHFSASDLELWCRHCWLEAARSAGLLRKISNEEEESQRQRDWVVMMTEKRRQQAEENRIKREEEALRRREEEVAKKEELIRKKDEDKKRREAIFEAYKLKKESEKLKEEGMNFFSSKPPPKLRPKSAGGSRMKPRPNTIHVDNREGGPVSVSQNNISSYRSLSRGETQYRRGSNVSLHDGGSGWSGDMKGLSMFSRSKSSSASNLGPNSLQLGIRGHRQRQDTDTDNCSEVSSTTSGYTSGRGSARLYREPVSKTNRPIIMNAVEYVVLPGAVNKETRRRVLEEIEKCDCPHFLILFRDTKLQFRALYAYYPDTEEVFKIHGVGPRQVVDSMMDNYFKYNSGGKKFSQIHTKHLTATIDAFTIHNSLWLGKKTKLPDKEMALVV